MISIIVPIYNSEKYLDRCIQSILSQTYKDFELLLIDDGSTDSSRYICEKYAKDDNRVRVVHKVNGGVSSARNLGIDLSQGEWLTFVDSDDWVDEGFLQKRYELAIRENADISYCDVKYVFETYEMYCHTANGNCLPESYVNNWILSRTTYSYILLVRKSLFENNKLRFLEGIRFCEDFNLIIKLVSYARKIVKVDEALYYYNKQNENSAMHNLSLFRDDLKIVYSDLINDFKRRNCYDDYKEMLSWCVLEYKLVSIVNSEHCFSELESFAPESHKYVLTTGFLDFKSKMLMFFYIKHLSFIADFMLYVYKQKKSLKLHWLRNH